MYGPNLRAVFENVLPLLRRYDVTTPNLVNDVKVYLQNSQAAASMLQAKSKNERKQLVEMITNYQLMKGLIGLFKLDPMLAFSSLREVSLNLYDTELCVYFSFPLSLSPSPFLSCRVIVIDLASVVSS